MEMFEKQSIEFCERFLNIIEMRNGIEWDSLLLQVKKKMKEEEFLF